MMKRFSVVIAFSIPSICLNIMKDIDHRKCIMDKKGEFEENNFLKEKSVWVRYDVTLYVFTICLWIEFLRNLLLSTPAIFYFWFKASLQKYDL